MTEYKEDIKNAEYLLKIHKEMECIDECLQSKIFLKFITLAKAFDNVEMPERRERTNHGSSPFVKITKENLSNERTLGYNEMHDIATPLIVKLNLRIKELEEMLVVNQSDWIGICKTNDELQAEIEELKEKLSQEYMKDCMPCGWKKKIEQFQQQLQSSKEEIELRSQSEKIWVERFAAMKDKMSEDNIVKIIKEEMKTSHWDIRGLAKAIIGNFNETH